MSSTKFKNIVWKYWEVHGRHILPWRKTNNPYYILVSEVMLQQTQVERVAPFYRGFVKKFPTPQKLANAPLAEVLKSWQGLGYNRRAKRLQQAAQQFVVEGFNRTRSGSWPDLIQKLERLPGVGPYTARAVAAFAYNVDTVFVETNIRTAIMYHFFPKHRKVSDPEILGVLTTILPKGRSRDWYAALMDYGAYLKRSGIKVNAQSKHYLKQSKFVGSIRQARGAILRALVHGSRTETQLLKLMDVDRVEQLRAALSALLLEGLIEKRGKTYGLPLSML
jgi:A/G-specific adenine glycosylase